MADSGASETLLGRTTSLCSTCKRSVDAALYQRDGRVVMDKTCAVHGDERVLISSDAAWYHRVMAMPAHLEAPRGDTVPVARGCPFDCGPCQSHEQRVHLPVVPITSACNLDCPICYTHNKNDGAYHMSPRELAAVLEHLRRRAPERRIINLTGGEPTLHPRFLELVEMCAAEGIHRITISTHGLTLLKNPALVERLAELDARVILSFDSFDEEVNAAMLGGRFGAAKLRVLDVLERHGIATTLLPVLARGRNDHEIARMVDLALSRDFIRSVEFHPMTFTGQGGKGFDRGARYTTYDALRDLERETRGRLRIDDFSPSPVAHPLCYQACYLLRLHDGRWLPLARFMDAHVIRSLLREGLYMEPSPAVERALEDAMQSLWAGEVGDERIAAEGVTADDILASMKLMIVDLFDADRPHDERVRRAERYTKAIYIHTHMDEETFDSDRIRQCSVGMPGADGSNIPSCAYNVLYRERDPRFIAQPAPPLVQLGAGRRHV